MTIKLSSNFNEVKQKWIDSVQNGEPVERQGELYSEMLDIMMDEAKQAGAQGAESFAGQTTLDGKLNASQRKFFNDINKEVGYKDEQLLPQETQDNIFDDMVSEHPLLAKIGLRNAGLRLKFLKAETTGVAVWGKIFGEIKGQLEATFNDDEAIQNKLTCFVVVPKDLEDFGPGWIERFVRLQIQEAFSVALELAFLTGDGQDKPIGLDRDINNGSTSGSTTTYPRKAAEGVLTFADPKTTVKEITGIYKYHSVKENGKPLSVAGKVVMVVNPGDAWDVKTQYTHLNANGVYVTALPYNLDIVESVAQPKGEVLTFVTGRYDAWIGGGTKVNKFDQTLALEDMELYVAKTFAHGRAKDIKATAVWTLTIPVGELGN